MHWRRRRSLLEVEKEEKSRITLGLAFIWGCENQWKFWEGFADAIPCVDGQLIWNILKDGPQSGSACDVDFFFFPCALTDPPSVLRRHWKPHFHQHLG